MASVAKNTTALNLRQGPGTQYAVLSTLPTGTLIHVLEQGGTWLRVIAQEQEGYVHRDYIEFANIVRLTDALSLHAGPGADTPIIANLPPNVTLSSFKEVGEWVHVIAWGDEGYVSREAVEFPRVGITTTQLNMRQGPGLQYPIVEVLPISTEVHIWEELGDWLRIGDVQRAGFVHSDYVSPPGQALPESAEEQEEAATTPRPTVEETSAMAPPESEKIHLAADAGSNERRVANTWNRLGGLLKALSAQLNINPGVAVAVLTIESGGRAFGSDGRMIIRFENQIFYDYWGKNHPDLYAQHFTFNANQRWRDHQWRPAVHQAWQSCHGSQQVEWDVLNFASTLDDTAAKLAISMGGAQIMGFNHKTVGYATVQQMFDDFSTSERHQIIGFFSFVKANPKRLTALQGLDFKSFAESYNGPGQATRYGNLIRNLYDIYTRLT